MFVELVRYKEEHGDCKVPQSYSESPRLGKWVGTQRTNHKRGALSADRVRRLEALGFIWDPSKDAWEDMFAELVRYKEEHGDCRVPNRHGENPSLGAWMGAQRTNYKRGTLSADRVNRLEALGFVWDPSQDAWEDMFAELVRYNDKHGNCKVLRGYSENPSLAAWVGTQRTNHKRGTLSADRVNRLEALGFVWDPFDEHWESMFSELVQYKEMHGDCDVPQNSTTHKSLGIWVARQRRSYDRGELSTDRIDSLETLGFAWDILSTVWEKRFSELCRYKSEHGDCNVPRHWKKNRHLGYWVNTQRIDYKEGILPEEKVTRLEAVGFQWSPNNDRWEKMFLELAEYQKLHGTCNVPRKLTGNSELANWVGTQRRKRRMGSLPSNLVARLDDLGFAWDRFEEAWEAKFQQLQAYKSVNGNCNVPIDHPEYPSLGSWVSDQRKRLKQGKLSEKRRKRLDTIGFRF